MTIRAAKKNIVLNKTLIEATWHPLKIVKTNWIHIHYENGSLNHTASIEAYRHFASITASLTFTKWKEIVIKIKRRPSSKLLHSYDMLYHPTFKGITDFSIPSQNIEIGWIDFALLFDSWKCFIRLSGKMVIDRIIA